MTVGSQYCPRCAAPLDCFWLATIVDGNISLDPSEASEHRWYSLVDVPELAFETMNRALVDARRCLRAAATGN
jgi:hypothetical protein